MEFISYTVKRREDLVFVVAGGGTHANILKNSHVERLFFLGRLNRIEFDQLVGLCHIGLIALDYRFTIPNLPSRLLSYLSNSLPVLCLVDRVTDIGTIAERFGFGCSAISDDIQGCYEALSELLDSNKMSAFGAEAMRFLFANYGTAESYKSIIKHLN